MQSDPSAAEISRRGQILYEERIRPIVEASNRGKFLVLDLETGDYEMDEDDLIASRRAKDRHPNGILYAVRIGHPAAYRLGGQFMGRPG